MSLIKCFKIKIVSFKIINKIILVWNYLRIYGCFINFGSNSCFEVTLKYYKKKKKQPLKFPPDAFRVVCAICHQINKKSPTFCFHFKITTPFHLVYRTTATHLYVERYVTENITAVLVNSTFSLFLHNSLQFVALDFFLMVGQPTVELEPPTARSLTSKR